jgi:hypothetical protein
MAFLRINGWQVHVASAQATRRLIAPGRRGRSFRGQIRDSRRDHRAAVEVQTIFADADDAFSLQQLLLGRGHFFDFGKGVEATTSLMPDYVHPLITLTPTGTGAFGVGGGLTIPAGALDAVFVVDPQLRDDEWSLVARVLVEGIWTGYAWRADGASFVSGARNDTAGRPVANGGLGLRPVVTDGIVHLVKDTTGAVQLDDLMILSFRASDSMLAAFTGTTTSKPSIPELVAEGDVFGTSSGDKINVLGEVGDIDVVQGRSSIPGRGWVNNARQLRFTLYAVDPTFAFAP